MQIRWKKHEDTLEVGLKGELDADNVEELNRFFKDGDGTGETRIVLDLSELDYVDSSGLGSFVRLMKESRARGGDVRLVGPTNEVKKVLELTRLNRVFDVRETVVEAIERFCPVR
ncbi:MAG: STAS domain-containing protein [Candidatus Eisenbacteria bacterium]